MSSNAGTSALRNLDQRGFRLASASPAGRRGSSHRERPSSARCAQHPVNPCAVSTQSATNGSLGRHRRRFVGVRHGNLPDVALFDRWDRHDQEVLDFARDAAPPPSGAKTAVLGMVAVAVGWVLVSVVLRLLGLTGGALLAWRTVLLVCALVAMTIYGWRDYRRRRKQWRATRRDSTGAESRSPTER